MTNRLREGRISLGLWFKRDESPPPSQWQTVMVVNSKLPACHKLQAGSKESKLGMVCGTGNLKAHPSDALPPARPHLLGLRKTVNNWDQVIRSQDYGGHSLSDYHSDNAERAGGSCLSLSTHFMHGDASCAICCRTQRCTVTEPESEPGLWLWNTYIKLSYPD